MTPVALTAQRLHRLDTPAKRAALPPRPKPYFIPAGAGRDGASLGYRRNASGQGTWIARLKIGNTPMEHGLGAADDAGAAPDALTFAGARAKALAWCERQRELTASVEADAQPMTVENATEGYLAALDVAARARATGTAAGASDARAMLARHLIGGGKAKHAPARLAARRLDKLTRADLQGWLREIDPALAPATVARLLTSVRAMLRGAWARAGHATPPGWNDLVREGLNAKAARRPTAAAARGIEDVRPDVLTDADVRRLLDAAKSVDADLHRLLTVIAATGLRFSQVARIRVRDVDADNATITVPTSHKGDSLTKATTNKAQEVRVHVAPDVIATLRPVLNGRRGDAVLLTRRHHVQLADSRATGRGDWQTTEAGRRVWVAERETEARPWTGVEQVARLLARAVAVAELPEGITTYHLRDWSIIRMLRRGFDPVTIARRHDTSIAMIARSYGRHILTAQDAALRDAAPALTSATPAPLRAVG